MLKHWLRDCFLYISVSISSNEIAMQEKYFEILQKKTICYADSYDFVSKAFSLSLSLFSYLSSIFPAFSLLYGTILLSLFAVKVSITFIQNYRQCWQTRSTSVQNVSKKLRRNKFWAKNTHAWHTQPFHFSTCHTSQDIAFLLQFKMACSWHK